MKRGSWPPLQFCLLAWPGRASGLIQRPYINRNEVAKDDHGRPWGDLPTVASGRGLKTLVKASQETAQRVLRCVWEVGQTTGAMGRRLLEPGIEGKMREIIRRRYSGACPRFSFPDPH